MSAPMLPFSDASSKAQYPVAAGPATFSQGPGAVEKDQLLLAVFPALSA